MQCDQPAFIHALFNALFNSLLNSLLNPLCKGLSFVNCHVAHGVILLFDQVYALIIIAQFVLGDADHPLDEIMHLVDVLPAVAFFARHAIEVEHSIGSLAGLFDLFGDQLCGHQQGKDVVAGQHVVQLVLQVQQFDAEKVKADGASHQFVAVMVGPEVFAGVGQDGHADDRLVKAFDQPVIVGEHAAGKLCFRLALHLDMQQDPVKLAAQRTHTNQFVDMPAGVAAVAGEFLQLGIHEGRFMAPVQPGSHLRKQQLQAGLEKHFNRRFPGAVMVADRHTGISSGVVWVRHASSFCQCETFLCL